MTTTKRIRQSPSGILIEVAGACLPLSHEIYVDGGTLVPLADQDGSICTPFKTIAPAFAKSLTLAGPVVIRALASRYVEELSWPDKDDLSLIGSGPGETIIEAPAASALLLHPSPAMAADKTIRRAGIHNLTLRLVDEAQTAISFVSLIVAPDTWLADGILFDRVKIEQTDVAQGAPVAVFGLLGRVRLVDCDFAPTDSALTAIANASSLIAARTLFGGLSLGWNYGVAVPGSGRIGFELRDSTQVQNGCSLFAQPVFFADETVSLSGTEANPALKGTFGDSITPGVAQVVCEAVIGSALDASEGNVDLSFGDLFLNASPLVNFDGAIVYGDFKIEVTAGATRLNNALAAGAVFRNGVNVSDLVDLDIRHSGFVQAGLVAGGTGTIDRDRHMLFDQDVSAAGPVIPIVPPFRTALYVVDAVTRAGIAALLSVPVKGNSSATLTYAGAEPGRTADVIFDRLDE